MVFKKLAIITQKHESITHDFDFIWSLRTQLFFRIRILLVIRDYATPK